MDAQNLIDIALGAVITIIGALSKLVYNRIDGDITKLVTQQEESLKIIHSLALNLATNYAPRTEIEKSLDELKDMVRRIEERITK